MNETSRSLRRLRYLLDSDGLTDGQLLKRFRADHNEAAFEALVRRHGPMVLGVCRRVLQNHHDAEDAFQATFLILARKSGSIVADHLVPSWLYGVAYRTAQKAKTQAAKIHAREKSMAVLPDRSDRPLASLNELQIVLDRELNRLPDKYRAPLILCEIEGRTHNEAARQLGWPIGTVSVRLMRAKKILADRLSGQKMGAGGALLSALLCVDKASANLPPALLADTANHATLFAAGQAGAAIPAKVLALVQGMLKSILLTKVKSLLTVLTLVGVMGTSAVYSTQLLKGGAEAGKPIDAPKVQAKEQDRPKRNELGVAKEPPPSRQKEDLPPGAIARIGSAAFRTGIVHGSAMSADGRALFVASSSSKAIDVYDLDTGLPLRQIPAPLSLSILGQSSFTLSPDGTLIAGTRFGGGFLWDVKSGKELRKLATARVNSAAFSPDGKKLVVENFDPITKSNGVRVLDVASGVEDCRFLETQTDITQTLFTPDGKTLIAISHKSGVISVNDFPSKTRLRDLNVEGAAEFLVALSPDGKTLAIAERRGKAVHGSTALRFVDLASGQSRHVNIDQAFPVPLNALIFSPDGAFLLNALLNRTCRVIDVARGTIIKEFPCASSRLHFTPDGRRLVGLGEKSVHVWDWPTLQELRAPRTHGEIADHVVLSPDGSILASWADKAPIRCWSTATGQLLASFEGHDRFSYVKSATFAPNGRLICCRSDGAIAMWDVLQSKQTARFEVPDPGSGAMSVVTDGRTLATFVLPRKLPPNVILPQLPGLFPKQENPNVRLFAWDLPTGKLLHKNELPAMNRQLPSLSPQGNRYLALSGNDIFVLDMLTDRELVKLRPIPQPNVPDVDPNFIEGPACFSADGKIAALVVSHARNVKDRTIQSAHHAILFDIASGSELSRIPVKGRDLRTFALAPDGRRAASIIGGAARICDAATGESLWQAPDDGAEVVALAFSADGNRLVAALEDTTFLVWDVSTSLNKASKQGSP